MQKNVAMSAEALARFTSIIRDRAERFAVAKGLAVDAIDVPTNFVPDEAVGFLRALDHEIVDLNDTGRCFLPRIHRAIRKPTEPCLFGVRNDLVYFAWREYVTQVGAVASLVLDYGWPEELVALDPRPEQTFDVAAFSSRAKDARMLVAVEVKKNLRELDALLRQMRNAEHPQLARTGSDGWKKYEGLRKEKAQYFCAVAPGVFRAFRVDYNESGATLNEIHQLPMCAEVQQMSGRAGRRARSGST